jgi:CRISPR/Cas system-associated endonuclease/helicase Cas3
MDATGQAVEFGRDISPDSIITEQELFSPLDEPEA